MTRQLENWLVQYTEYTKHLEAPDYFHLWAGVATIAGALRGKCWIDMGYFKWKPNFFIIYVGPPGIVSKSTTMNAGMELLREVPGIHFGPDSATWQGITAAFEESTEGVELPNVPTDEEVGNIYTMSALTIAASELGTFLDPKNREMIDVLVDLWDGRDIPWKRRLKHEGESIIANPWINFVGCTTPAWIEGNFPQYAIGGGFTSRTVFIYGERKRHFVAYPKEHIIPEQFLKVKQMLIDDLTDISTICGEYVISPDALKWGEEWYLNHWLNRRDKFDDQRFGGYVARKQTHIHKLAMVLAASHTEERIISQIDLEMANSLITDLEENMPRVFSQITDSRDAKYAAALYAAAQKLGKTTKEELWRTVFNLMSYMEFENALTGCIHAGFFRMQQVDNDLFISPVSPQERPRAESPERAAGTLADVEPQSRGISRFVASVQENSSKSRK